MMLCKKEWQLPIWKMVVYQHYPEVETMEQEEQTEQQLKDNLDLQPKYYLTMVRILNI